MLFKMLILVILVYFTDYQKEAHHSGCIVNLSKMTSDLTSEVANVNKELVLPRAPYRNINYAF